MDGTEQLNAAQLEAVQHVDGPLLILAGPGSGKTRVVTHRIANLLANGVLAKQILALTFTNKAADEMRQRLNRLVPRQAVWMGTFHRFCAYLLRSHANRVGLSENYSIFDTDDSGRVLRQVIDDLALDLTHVTPDSIASAISWAKSNLVTAADYVAKPGNPLGAIVAKVYPAYQQRLLAANGVDFDDLLLHVAVMLREHDEIRRDLDERYRYIMVDEYQDTNLAQYAIVRSLSVERPNLAVTGDPDQSIYGWRGANISNILEFERDYPNVRVVRLEQNYRSTKRILSVAHELIRHNVRRKDKKLFTDNEDGTPVRLAMYPTGRDEAEDIAEQIVRRVQSGERRARDYAILYRTNSLSRLLEHALRHRGVPYQILQGLEFYHRKEIKDVLSYLQLINNPRNDVALERVINMPPRGIGKTTVSRLTDHARQHHIGLLDAARQAGQVDGLNGRAVSAVTKFVAMYDELSKRIDTPLHELIRQVLERSGYRVHLESSELEEDADRLANLEELISAAMEFDEEEAGDNRLERFLEQTALVSDTDDWESESDKVTLLTLHSAKGLEFPCVYVVAFEEGILPHERNLHDRDRLEEERRLLFVGMTRAEQDLQLSMAFYRMRGGRTWPTVASQFSMELPRGEMSILEPSPAYREHADGDSADRSGDDSFDPRDWDDEPVFDVHGEREPSASRSANSPAGAKLRTAAELAASTGSIEVDESQGAAAQDGAGYHEATGYPPHLFRKGMRVFHPEYGHGEIIGLSGQADKRMATVQFVTDGQKTFRLLFSPLVPSDIDVE